MRMQSHSQLEVRPLSRDKTPRAPRDHASHFHRQLMTAIRFGAPCLSKVMSTADKKLLLIHVGHRGKHAKELHVFATP
jgi:hypothetical protein